MKLQATTANDALYVLVPATRATAAPLALQVQRIAARSNATGLFAITTTDGGVLVDPSSTHHAPTWQVQSSTWSSHVVNTSADDYSVQLVLLDDAVLLPESACAGTESNCTAKQQAQAAQLEWLETTLAASRSHWLFVAGQQSLCRLVPMLGPLLETYRVDAYFGVNSSTTSVAQVPLNHSVLNAFSYAQASVGGAPQQCASVYDATPTVGTVSQHVLSRFEMYTTMYSDSTSDGFSLRQTRLPKAFEAATDGNRSSYVAWVIGGGFALLCALGVLYGLKYKGQGLTKHTRFPRQGTANDLDELSSLGLPSASSTGDRSAPSSSDEEEDQLREYTM
ncbi:hypothetical protein ACHHYP_06908 [Achlya hypogyna]|uniref:Uncharacterized protein n=1 Tax=Achlya hypogyna TaxID=1202772 RepID=A0A1V9ZN32_ACHHY|nr:hypothetical protein ACHHYP_06908 [Achlya hypogyna]